MTNTCEKQSYGKHAYFHESHKHMKSFALVPNSDSEGYAFLEGKGRERNATWKACFQIHTHFSQKQEEKKRKKEDSHKCYIVIWLWQNTDKSISNVVYCSFNYVTAFIHFKRPEIFKAFVIHTFK